MNSWQSVKLGSFIRYATDKISSDGLGLHNYISTENMLQDKAGICKAAGMPSTGFATRYAVGDTLISNIRPYFKKIWFADRDGGASNDVIVFKTDELDKKYLYYLLSQDEFFNYVMSGSKGTKMPRGDKEQIKQFTFVLPSLTEQKAIAGVLGALDDKIENNRKENKTLEDMAAALFKSCFVDFEPFGGTMPAGWKEVSLGSVCDTLLGGTPSRDKKGYWENGTIPWINSGEINKFRIVTPSEYITQEALDNSATKLMPSRTCVIAITGATLGQVSLIEIECCANQSVVGILGNDVLPSEFIYLFIKHNIQILINRQSGGAQQHINKNDVNETKIIVPTSTTMQKFIDFVRPLFDKITTNELQSRTLAGLRDSLLPRLMSGKIRVPPFGDKQ